MIPAAFEGIEGPSLDLARQPDTALRKHVRAHLTALNRLVDETRGHPERVNAVEGNEQGPAKIIAQLQQLKLTDIQPPSADQQLVRMTIGGVLDNTVGFFYAPHPDDLPPVSPDEYIYIEQAAPNWYVFKTT